MAVFYFSTRGDRWTECSAPPPIDEVDDPEQAIAEANAQCTLEVAGFESGSNAWLTGASECTWGGLGCNQDKVITRIEFGEYHVGYFWELYEVYGRASLFAFWTLLYQRFCFVVFSQFLR